MQDDIQFVRFVNKKKVVEYRPLRDIRRVVERKDGNFDVYFGTGVGGTDVCQLLPEEIATTCDFRTIALKDAFTSERTDGEEDDEDDED